MKGVLHLKGMGAFSISYKGCVEAILTIPYIPTYNEDVLFLVVANHRYGDRVQVQIGILVIDQLVTKKELQMAWETWKQVHLGTIVSKRNTIKGLDVPEYRLEGVKGKICTMRVVMIPPFGTTVLKALQTQQHIQNIYVLLWSSCRIFRTHCYSQIIWGTKTRERQDQCLPQES